MQYASSRQQAPSPAREAQTCEQPAVATAGNQAQVEQAGLSSADRADDLAQSGDTAGSWLDGMADFVLDLLPFDAAVQIARARRDDPEVQRWADGVAPADALDWVQRRSDAVVDAVWPVGTGPVGEAELGGALGLGADVLASFEVLRRDGDTLSIQATQTAELGLGGDGVEAALTDAFGATVAAAGAGLGGKLVAEHGLQRELRFDLVELVRSGVMTAGGPLSGLLLGVGSGLALADAAGLVEQAPAQGWIEQTALSFRLGGGARLAADLGTGVLSPELLARVPELAQLSTVVQGILAATGGLDARLETGTEGARLCVRGGVDVLAALGSSLPWLAELTGFSGLLDGMRAEHGFEAELDVGLDLAGGAVTALDGHAQVALRRTDGDTTGTLTDTLSCSLAQAAALFGRDGASVDAMLDGGAASFCRQVEVPVAGDRLAELMPGVARHLLSLGVAPAVQQQATFTATGSIVADAAALGALAGLGIQGPEGWPAAAVVQAIGRAVVALRAGAPLADAFLEPHRAALQGVADGLQLVEPRLLGTVRLGLGGGVSLPQAGATSRATGGIAVDQLLQPAETAAVERALLDRP